MAKETNTETQSGGSGKRTKLIIVTMAVLLVGAIGAVAWLLLHRNPTAAATASTTGDTAQPAEKSTEKTAEPSATHEPLFLALDPPFIVNFQSDSSAHFLQVGVQLMARDQRALDAAKASDPVVRNALLMLFSSQDAKTLISREGKEKLRSDAQVELQKIVTERATGAVLEAVYFTSFVMQ
jgi:flagellar FliL protein